MTASARPPSHSPSIRVLVVDGHPVFREALARAIADESDFLILGQADDVMAVEAWQRHRPDVTLLDVAASGVNGIATLRRIRVLDKAARVIVLASSHQQSDERAAMEAGASAYVSRMSSYEHLLQVIRSLHSGDRQLAGGRVRMAHADAIADLSDRETEVLRLLCNGLSHEAIAVRLSVTDRTVRAHLTALKTKLSAASAAQCVARGYELGLLKPSVGINNPGSRGR